MKFTEKVFHLAAREHHLKDLFSQKSKVEQKSEKMKFKIFCPKFNEKYCFQENTANLLWLKDKADEFHKNKDYYSAMIACNAA